VYRMYKTGELISDDEVALVFDPVSGCSLSEPLINIRFTLRKARDAGVISRGSTMPCSPLPGRSSTPTGRMPGSLRQPPGLPGPGCRSGSLHGSGSTPVTGSG